jgi:hypothetical protein
MGCPDLIFIGKFQETWMEKETDRQMEKDRKIKRRREWDM